MRSRSLVAKRPISRRKFRRFSQINRIAGACLPPTIVRGRAARVPVKRCCKRVPLPPDLLDVAPKTMDRLHLLGIKTLGDLARLPHGPFVRRFGGQAARWHAYARGNDDNPIAPRAHELQIDASLYGEGTATQEE